MLRCIDMPKRPKKPPHIVSSKAREEEKRFLKRWKGVKQKEHTNLWQKKESDPVWAEQIEDRLAHNESAESTMGNKWGVRKRTPWPR